MPDDMPDDTPDDMPDDTPDDTPDDMLGYIKQEASGKPPPLFALLYSLFISM